MSFVESGDKTKYCAGLLSKESPFEMVTFSFLFLSLSKFIHNAPIN